MMEEIVVTPWSSDSEWQSVRQDIYESKDNRNYKRALRKLLIWKTRVKSLSRGLHCTELILQVITKDAQFCDVNDEINESDLVRLYSMAIMKFVNLTADILGKGPQKSMYYRASRLELPSWLIDMRHKISHDQDLPNLNSLRTAIEFALEWLQVKYWNVDENFLVVTPKLNVEVVDKFMNIVESYMLSKLPTNTSFKEESINTRKQFSNCEFTNNAKSNKERVKQIKELISNDVWSSKLVNVFVTRFLLQAKECNISKDRISKPDKAIWSTMIKTINTSGLLTKVLQCLVTQNSRIAALWVIELCIVVYKSSKKIDIQHNLNDYCMNCKPTNLDSCLVLKTALNSPHAQTILFLKWLLRIQSNTLKVKQQYNIYKLVSLYTGSVKITSKNSENVYTINDLISQNKNQQESPWSLAFGPINWKQIPFGTNL